MKRIYYVNLEKTSEEELGQLRKQYMTNPMSLLEVNEKDAQQITGRIKSFLKSYLIKSKTEGYVVGLSGGLDSSVAGILAEKAVGAKNVFAMLLPSKFTGQNHINDALEVARLLKIRTNNYEKVRQNFDKAVELTMYMTEIEKNHSNYDDMLGNNHARERMKILRGKAASLNYLVLGTTNATEAWLGYATIAGDGYKGIDVEPLQMLPKTSERMYARFIGTPEQIIKKAPSADLKEGQTDEGDFDMCYEDIDRVMTGHFLGISIDNIVKANNRPEITKRSIDRIVSWAKKNEFKAKPEPYANLGE